MAPGNFVVVGEKLVGQAPTIVGAKEAKHMPEYCELHIGTSNNAEENYIVLFRHDHKDYSCPFEHHSIQMSSWTLPPSFFHR